MLLPSIHLLSSLTVLHRPRLFVMRSFASTIFTTWLASLALLHPIVTYAQDSCTSDIERDVIIVGGGSGGT